MRYLIVSPYPPDRCGIAAYTLQLAAGLRREGHTTEVVSNQPSAADHHADLYSVRGCLKVARLSWGFDQTLIEFFPELLFPSLRRDLFLRQWPVVALLLSCCRNVELVVHEAPYAAVRQTRGLRGLTVRRLWQRLLALPQTVAVHTPWERQQMAEAIGFPEDRVQLVTHGRAFLKRTEVDRSRARRELGLDEDEYVFLCIGFIQPHKGFDRAVRALSHLDGERLRLHIVGSTRTESVEIGAYVEELRQMSAGAPRVRLHEGYVNDEVFDRWIVACDAVVLPYREIWSSGVLERAKLYDRPAIATNVGGMSHQAGPLTRIVEDDEELCRAMAELAGVPAKVEDAHPIHLAAETPVNDAVQPLVWQRANALRARIEGAPEVPEPPLPEGLGPAGDMGLPPPLTIPLAPAGRGPKTLALRVVNKLSRWQLIPVVARLNELRSFHAEERVAHRMLAEAQRVSEDEVRAWRAALDEQIAQAQVQLAEMQAALEYQKRLRTEDWAALLAELHAARAGAQGGVAHANGHVEDNRPRFAALYEAHQSLFRGSEDAIRDRLAVYLPHVRELDARDKARVLDIGPGRGEWLRLLRDAGVPAYGVDVNPRFVELGVASGLDVLPQDGVAHLRHVTPGSLAAVTAFHVIEHMSTETLIELVDLSLRALRPGGLLILETPNPLNVQIGAAWFNLDPTHVRAVHPLFLQFILENRGFVRLRTLVLHPPEEQAVEVPPESPTVLKRVAEVLNQQFFSGEDYAVMANRPAPAGLGVGLGRDAEAGPVQRGPEGVPVSHTAGGSTS